MLSVIEEKLLDDLYERDYNRGNEINPKNYYIDDKKDTISTEEWRNYLENLRKSEFIDYDLNNLTTSADIILTENGIKFVAHKRSLKRKASFKNGLNYLKNFMRLKDN